MSSSGRSWRQPAAIASAAADAVIVPLKESGAMTTVRVTVPR